MKYTKEEIRERSAEFCDLLKSGDPRCEVLLFILSAKTGIDPQQCLELIYSYAGQENDTEEEVTE